MYYPFLSFSISHPNSYSLSHSHSRTFTSSIYLIIYNIYLCPSKGLLLHWQCVWIDILSIISLFLSFKGFVIKKIYKKNLCIFWRFILVKKHLTWILLVISIFFLLLIQHSTLKFAHSQFKIWFRTEINQSSNIPRIHN